MTKPGWSRLTVQSLIDSGEAQTKTGPFGTQLKAGEYVEHGTPVINVRNIGFGTIKPDKLEYLADDTVRRLSSHLLQINDIVFGRKGAVERHVLIRPEQANWFQGSDCLRLRFISDRIDPRFVSYFFLTEGHKQWMMNQCSHGATMASLNQEIIWRISLYLPSIATQRKIATVLSAYDDLIANNTRRIAVLEEMAQSLYREWFVRFRFPGHEQTRFIETDQGRVPEGWAFRPLVSLQSSIPNAINGGPFGSKLGTKDYAPTGVPVIRGGNLSEAGRFSDEEFVYVSEEKADELRPNTALPGDIVVTQRGTLGQIGMVPHHTGHRRFIVSQSQMKITLDPAKVNILYAFYALKSQEANTRIKNLAISSGVPHINLGTLREFTINCPPADIQARFGSLVEPIDEHITLLTRKGRCLHRTRDLLLPKLIQGELDVEHLDIDTGEPQTEVTA